MECKWNRIWIFANDIPEIMAWTLFAFWVIVICALLVRLLAYIFEGSNNDY